MSGQAVVLTEEIDEDYEPTEQELKEYADWLGMDLEEDKDLLWIARQGLKAPLPHPWKPCQTQEDGEIFYFNFETGESVWDHPCDDYHRQLYETERAKKRGEVLDDGSQGEGEGSQSQSQSEGKEKKEKKGKKEKKKKTAEKDEKEASDLPKQLEAPSSLPPLTGSLPLSGAGALKGGEATIASTNLMSTTAGEGQPQNERQEGEKEEKDEVLEMSLGESMVSATEEQPHMDESPGELPQGHADVGISSLREGDTLEVSVSEDQIHFKIEANEASSSEIASLLAEAEASIADLKSKLEVDTAKQRKELEDWHKEEARKCAKQRQEWQAEFEDQRDATFAELQAEHEKRVRDEKQRLQQEFASKKKALKEEMDVNFEQDKEQLEQIKALQAEKEKLTDALSASKRAIDEQAADAKTGKDEEKEYQERVQTLQEENEKLATDLLIAKNIANDKEESLTSHISKLQTELEEVKAAVNQKSSELSSIIQQLKDVQAERDFAVNQAESLKQDIGSLRLDLQRVKSEMQTQVTDLTEKLRLKTEECEQLMEKSLDLTDRLMEDEGSQQDVKRLQAQVSEKSEEVQWVKAEKKVLEEKVDQLQVEVEKLQALKVEAAKAENLSSEITALRDRSRKEAEQHQQELETCLAKAEEASRKEQDRLRAEVKTLEAELKQLSAAEVESVKLSTQQATEVTRLKGEILRLESQERTLQSQLETSRTAADRAEADSARWQEQLQKLEDKSAAEARQNQAVLQEARLGTERASVDAAALQREVSRLQAKADAAERIRHELGSLDGLTNAAEAAAAEAARSTHDAHWRQEVQRLEGIARVKATELAKAKEQAQRSQEEVRRMEQDERRASQRIAFAQEEADGLRKELAQLREDAAEAERHVEDVRANLRAENNLRLSAEATLRKSTREITSLGDQLAMQTAAAEQFAAEARRLRAEVADLEAELARSLQQLRACEAELNHGRAQQDAKAKQSNNKLAMHWYELAEQEYGISAREARVHERERRVTEAAKLLEEQRQGLVHLSQQRHLDEPTPVSLESRFAAGVPVIEQDLVEGNLPAGAADGMPGSNAAEEIPVLADEMTNAALRGAGDGLQLVDPDLDTRRQELRRERAAFEELRQQCRAQMARLRRSSPEVNSEANVLLQDMQGTLDAHAHVFNKSVNELRARVKQRASKAKAMQAITPARATPSSTRSASLRPRVTDWEEPCETAQPASGSFAIRPRTPHSARSTKVPGGSIAAAWTTPKSSRQALIDPPHYQTLPMPLDVWEQDALWLRGKEPRTIPRSASARASMRTASPRREMLRGW